MKKINLKIIGKIIYFIIVSCLVFLTGLFALSSFNLNNGLRVFTVQSGSMEPLLHTGGIVIIKKMEKYSDHDVVTYKIRGTSDTASHRIVETITNDKNETHFRTKGDANSDPDGELISPVNVIGKVIFSLPLLGFPISFARTQLGFLLIIIIPATIIIYSELLTIKNETIKLLQDRKKRKLTTKEKIEVEIGEEEIKIEKWYHRLIKKIFEPFNEATADKPQRASIKKSKKNK